MLDWSTAIVPSQHEPRMGAAYEQRAPTVINANPLQIVKVIGIHKKTLSG
jgi:hypothetical protein